MRNLKFQYIKGQNIFCFGNEGIEIKLDEIGNIIYIRGENLDVKKEEEDEKVSSNGSGKSSIPEILVYCLYGKTIKKKLGKDQVINNKVGKKLYTEVIWDKYRVVRQRKPNKLRVWRSEEHEWEDENEITLGTMPATQDLIEELIGLNYQTFVNLVVFADNNADSFLECDADGKRRIVENLLNLEQYRTFFDEAKAQRTQVKNQIKIIESEVIYAQSAWDSAQNRISELAQKEVTWEKQKKQEVQNMHGQIAIKQAALDATDAGIALAHYEQAQKDIEVLNAQIDPLTAKEAEIQAVIPNGRNAVDKGRTAKNTITMELQQHQTTIKVAHADIEQKMKFIQALESKKGSTCDMCYGPIKEENFQNVVVKARNVIDHHQGLIKKETELINLKLQEVGKKQEAIKKAEALVAQAEKALQFCQSKLDGIRQQITKLSRIERPDATSEEKLLMADIKRIQGEIVAGTQALKGPSPYIELVASAKKEVEVKKTACKDKKAELNELTEALPYYEFWVKGFGSKGIPRFAINGIVPALNSAINYFLQFLIDGKIKLTFNGELEELIERNPADGDPFVYHAMSGGERRRLNLAVSQAFAHIMSLSSDTCPSVVFLDEVTTNIDPTGVVGVYQMISELSKEKQVFVTTHDQDLMEMLTGCEQINLQKENGITVAV